MSKYSGLLHMAMKRSAARNPKKIAFKVPGSSLSYKELAEKSNQVSNLLIKHGLQKGDRVAILMHRCIETAYSIYGILQAGGVYVPLDPKAPVKRLEYQIENCDLNLVLTVEQQKRTYSQLDCTCLVLNDEVLEEEASSFSELALSSEDNAYILYTSGSTGTPKGILHTHGSGFAFAKLCQSTFQIKEADIIANHAPIFFDISTLAYFAGPLSGATALIIPDAYTVMAASMVDLIVNEGVTVWYSVPLALVQMLDTGRLSSEMLSKLETIFYAGEAFQPRQLRRLMTALPGRRIINLYGPTETNVCTYHEVRKLPMEDERIPIGKTWDRTNHKILDDELLISSISTMKSYWAKPERTNSAFIEIEGEKYYKTGDLVEEIDNVLYLKGRRDHQVKFRGFRIELGDIENALSQNPDVKEAVALMIQNQDSQDEIVAVVRADQGVDLHQIKNFSKDLLPKYAVPSKIIMLDEFPRTSTGKVKRSEILKLVT